MRHRIRGNANTHDKLLQKENSYINSVCLTGCGFLRQFLLLQAEIIYCFIYFTVCIKCKNKVKWSNNIYANSTICLSEKREVDSCIAVRNKANLFKYSKIQCRIWMIWWSTNHHFTESWIFKWFPHKLF